MHGRVLSHYRASREEFMTNRGIIMYNNCVYDGSAASCGYIFCYFFSRLKLIGQLVLVESETKGYLYTQEMVILAAL